MIWSQMTRDERISAIRRAMHNDNSATDIAIALQTTRNAIIGFSWRRGISLNKDRRWGQYARQHSKKYTRNKPKARTNYYVKKPKTPPQLLSRPLPPITNTIKSKPLLFVDAERHHCRYPLWDDTTPADERRICGAETYAGSSWCDGHYHAVFVPPA